MRFIYGTILLVFFACSQKKTETTAPPITAADSVNAENKRRVAIWKSISPLPKLETPFKLSISDQLGTPIHHDSLLYKMLVTNDALSKRAIGAILNPNDAQVFWIGKRPGNGGIWRLFVTNISSPLFDPHPVTSELDAAGEDVERCSAHIVEHWTAVNEFTESRSFVKFTKECKNDTILEMIRTRQINPNGAYDESMPHPFTMTPLHLPSSVAIESDTLQWYFNGAYLGPYLSKLFFKDRPLLFNFEKIAWTKVPDEFDGRLFLALTRNGVPDPKNPTSGRKQTQFAFVSAEKIGYKTYRAGRPIELDVWMIDDPNNVSDLPVFENLHDHYLRIKGAFTGPGGREEYAQYIVRHGYDLKFLNDLSAEMLRLERNYLFARYGYIFKSADLAEYFKQFAWYNPTVSNADQIVATLNEDDKALLDAIKQMEEYASRQ
jgi:hypothetical protein